VDGGGVDGADLGGMESLDARRPITGAAAHASSTTRTLTLL